MFNHTYLIALATTMALFATPTASLAYTTLDNNAVVRDTNDNVVHNTAFGTCVRTHWEAGFDVCDPEPQTAELVEPAPATRTILKSNEKVVYFPFDSAELTEDARTQLNSMAVTLRGAKDIKSADIVGYADRIGSNNYNKSLSERRANAVKDYLNARGYLHARVPEVRGLGESKPVTTCDASLSRNNQISCLSPDRRVEVEVQYIKNQKVSQTQY